MNHLPGAQPTDLADLVQQVAQALSQRGWMLATAESCTGGLIAATCTELAGSSAWFDRGVVSYSNEAKTELLGVPAALIDQHGAVSKPVALAMAEGILRRSNAHIAVAVTGIAGPGGGSPDKPVGTVWLAWARRNSVADETLALCEATCLSLPGDRAQVRKGTVIAALRRVMAQADQA
jgi:nicotinamide-nucleotide amidase